MYFEVEKLKVDLVSEPVLRKGIIWKALTPLHHSRT